MGEHLIKKHIDIWVYVNKDNLHILKVSSHKKLSNYKGENNSFTVEKPDGQYL